MKKATHPGKEILDLINKKSISQRELASLIQISPSVLNGILVNKKTISPEVAIKLASLGFGKAQDWLIKQAIYNLHTTMDNIEDEASAIKEWSEIKSLIPFNFFKKQGVINSNIEESIKSIFEVYGVKNLNQFKKFHSDYIFSHYRKSSAFKEQRNNVIAWSTLAEYIVKDDDTKKFTANKKEELINHLNKIFYKNPKTILSDVKNLLSNYGIKFEILDRPSKTPVDGKSFMSEGNPAIVLSLKYKRLDNFAFTIMHELGHVFLHLTKKHKEDSFFINSSKNSILEFEANQFARNALIPQEEWENFEYSTEVFSDNLIRKFARKIKVHPAIVRGRVCFEYNNYYRRKSNITQENKINFG